VGASSASHGRSSCRFRRPRIARATSELGIRSHLSIPLRAGGPLLGVLTFDSVRGERDWPDEVVNRLWLLSEAFASALDRKRMELSLADRLRFHRLLSHLSARLGNTRAVDLDREVHGALGRIVDFAAVDHATIVEFADRAGERRSWAIGDPLDHERTLSVMDRARAGEDVRVFGPKTCRTTPRADLSPRSCAWRMPPASSSRKYDGVAAINLWAGEVSRRQTHSHGAPERAPTAASCFRRPHGLAPRAEDHEVHRGPDRSPSLRIEVRLESRS